jgi:hypothetical protein
MGRGLEALKENAMQQHRTAGCKCVCPAAKSRNPYCSEYSIGDEVLGFVAKGHQQRFTILNDRSWDKSEVSQGDHRERPWEEKAWNDMRAVQHCPCRLLIIRDRVRRRANWFNCKKCHVFWGTRRIGVRKATPVVDDAKMV